MSLAWRMVIELVVSVMVGAAMGWGLDWLFGTLPAFLIVMSLFGFAAGVRMMMRAAEELQRKQMATQVAAEDTAANPAAADEDAAGLAATDERA